MVNHQVAMFCDPRSTMGLQEKVKINGYMSYHTLPRNKNRGLWLQRDCIQNLYRVKSE